jgi:hypothetical protein
MPTGSRDGSYSPFLISSHPWRYSLAPLSSGGFGQNRPVPITFEHNRRVSMARDKAKDDKHFNCTQVHEADYVAGLYPHARDEVKNFLESACQDKSLHNSTHKDVYDLIKRKLGHSQP